MNTAKIAGRNIREMADECCGKATGCHLSRYNWAIFCDDIYAANRLMEVLGDAMRYWKSVGKPSKALLAEKVREFVVDMISCEGYQVPRFSFGKTFVEVV